MNIVRRYSCQHVLMRNVSVDRVIGVNVVYLCTLATHVMVVRVCRVGTCAMNTHQSACHRSSLSTGRN